MTGRPLDLRTFEVTVEFEGTLSDEAFEILAGIPAPRRAVEGEPLREGFFPGRRIEYRWVQMGDWLVREDALSGMVEGMITDG